MRPAAYISSTFVALSLTSPVAAAEDPPDVNGFPVDPSEIYGGETVSPCGWPTTVSMLGSCTGTLVHPQVVIYAAHCGSNYNAVTLGETINGPKRQVQTEFCRTFPGGGPGGGDDFAFCKLTQPQTDIPIVPILMGCEVGEYLVPGQPVTIVGYGNADNGPYGIKREVVTSINNITPQGEADIGGGGKDSCQGDSGGPVYVQLKDGTWRVFGITSYGGACGTGGMYSLMHNGIQWFEQESGIDLTPCFDAVSGTWMPAPTCKDFPIDPGAGGGDWANGCGGGPVGQSATCGPPPCPMDDIAPTVSISMPADDTELSSPNMTDNVKVTVSINASDLPDMCYVKEVRLLIDGNDVGGVDYGVPYEFVDVSFPTGVWEVSARAIDYFDNQTDSAPNTLCINMSCPEPIPVTTGVDSDSDSMSGSGTTDLTTSGTSGGPGGGPGGGPTSATQGITNGDPEDPDGCACRSGQDPKASSLLVLGLAALGLRRRRRAGVTGR